MVTNEGSGRNGVNVADGKLEFIMDAERNLIVADTGLSYDENRLLRRLGDGIYVDLSKQLPRNIYTISAFEWREEVRRLLKEAKRRVTPQGRIRLPEPPEIGNYLKGLCSDACSVVSSALAGEGSESDLEEIALRVHTALEDLKRKYGRDEAGEML